MRTRKPGPQRRAPGGGQLFHAEGGVGGAGAGQAHGGDAAHRAQHLFVKAEGRCPVAEHRLHRRFFQKGGQVLVEAAQQDVYIEVTVKDTGCGIAAEDLQKVLNGWTTEQMEYQQ